MSERSESINSESKNKASGGRSRNSGLGRKHLVGLFSSAMALHLLVALLSGEWLGEEASHILWPPAGVMIAILILSSVLGTLAGLLAVGIGLLVCLVGVTGASLATVALTVAITSIYALGAWALRRSGFDPGFNDRRDFRLFLFTAVVMVPAASNGLILAQASIFDPASLPQTAGGLGSVFAQPELLGRSFLEGWIGDATGILVVSPPLLLLATWLRNQMIDSAFLAPVPTGGTQTWASHPIEPNDRQTGALISAALLLVVAGLSFTRSLPAELIRSVETGTLALILLLPVLWTSTRLSPGSASLFACIFSLIAVATTGSGQGPFPGEFVVLGPAWAYVVALFSSCLLLSLVLRGERRALALARGNRRLLERIVDHVPANISVKNERGNFVFMNQRLADFLGVDGQNPQKLLPYQVERLRPTLVDRTDELAMESGRLRMYEETQLEAADGDRHDFLQTRVPMLARGNRAELLTIQLDITDRKVAERALRESEAKLRSVMDDLAGWILLVNLSGTIEWANRTFQGTPPEDFVGTKTQDWTTAKSHQRGRELVRQVIQTGTAATYEVELKAPLEGWLSVVLSPVIDEGRVENIMMLITDVTELRRETAEKRRLETQMEQVKQIESLGALAGSVAHDFNNLLVGMLGNADYLVHHTDPESKDGRAVRRILKASERARELCDQLLDYAGHGSMRTEIVDLNVLVQETLPMLEGRLSSNATLNTVLSDNPPLISAEKTQLNRVLMNLVINASDALGEDGGEILVATGLVEAKHGSSPQRVFLSVADDGCGMNADTQHKIFDPFFSTKLQGRGLGLAACQGIVRQLGGSIEVKSREGSGTTFEVKLPIAQADQGNVAHEVQPLQPSNEQLEPTGPQADVVLLVEDDQAVVEIAQGTLEEIGVPVLVAESGNVAVDLFEQHQETICAVVLDLTLPGLMGDVVLDRIRALTLHVPVLISSGFASAAVSRRIEKHPGISYLPKPYRPEELADAVTQLIDQFRLASRIE